MKIKRVKNISGFDLTLLGQTINVGEYYTINKDRETEWVASQDVRDSITFGNILMNDGFVDITEISEGIKYLENLFEPYNPDDHIYMMQANMIYNNFLNHSEKIYLEESLINASVDTFQGYNKLESYSDVVVDGSALVLGGPLPTTYDLMEDPTTTWEDESDATLSEETTIIHEGVKSAKITNTKNDTTSLKGIKAVSFGGENWEAYTELLMWVYGEGIEERLQCKLKNGSGHGSDTYYTSEFM